MKFKNLLISIVGLMTLSACYGGNGQRFDSDTNTYSYPGQDMKERDVDYPSKIGYTRDSSILIHYHRDDNKYLNYGVYIFNPENEMPETMLNFNYQDSFGVIAYYPLSKFGGNTISNLNFVISKSEGESDEISSIRNIALNLFVVGYYNEREVFVFSQDENLYASKNKDLVDHINVAEFVDKNTVQVSCDTFAGSYTLYAGTTPIAMGEGLKFYNFTVDVTNHPYQEGTNYSITVTFFKSGISLTCDVSTEKLANN